ncbi:MAG: FtsX-like permease family protein [Acidobacteria bacterium]|nr:FtsX-like permease family protein [Acidobacteriota bacterium]
MRWFRQPDRTLEVVGVVRPVRHRGFDAASRETVYRPHTQYPRWTMFIAVKTSSDPSALAGPAAAAIQGIDPDQPIAEMTSMETLAARSIATPGFGAALSGALAAIALLLTVVGTYGLFAYAVSQRRREIGVRLALGASPHQIVGLVLRDGMNLALVGLAIGVPAGSGRRECGGESHDADRGRRPCTDSGSGHCDRAVNGCRVLGAGASGRARVTVRAAQVRVRPRIQTHAVVITSSNAGPCAFAPPFTLNE